MKWLDQLLLLPQLYLRMKVRRLKRGYVKLYAIECSERELAEVQYIETAQLMHLGREIRRLVAATRAIPRVRVLCFGRGADLSQAPRGIRHWVSAPFGTGAWMREMDTAIVLFPQHEPIWQIVVHEVSHALLDVLSGSFAYPAAIEEGFARLAEYRLPDRTGRCEWEKRSSAAAEGKRGLHESEYMSIAALLSFDSRTHWGRDLGAFAKMTHAAFWLVVYLRGLSRRCPRLKTILADLRINDITTPAGVYEWLQEASGMSADRLEEGFHRFCTTGRLPNSPCRQA